MPVFRATEKTQKHHIKQQHYFGGKNHKQTHQTARLVPFGGCRLHPPAVFGGQYVPLRRRERRMRRNPQNDARIRQIHARVHARHAGARFLRQTIGHDDGRLLFPRFCDTDRNHIAPKRARDGQGKIHGQNIHPQPEPKNTASDQRLHRRRYPVHLADGAFPGAHGLEAHRDQRRPLGEHHTQGAVPRHPQLHQVFRREGIQKERRGLQEAKGNPQNAGREGFGQLFGQREHTPAKRPRAGAAGGGSVCFAARGRNGNALSGRVCHKRHGDKGGRHGHHRRRLFRQKHLARRDPPRHLRPHTRRRPRILHHQTKRVQDFGRGRAERELAGHLPVYPQCRQSEHRPLHHPPRQRQHLAGGKHHGGDSLRLRRVFDRRGQDGHELHDTRRAHEKNHQGRPHSALHRPCAADIRRHKNIHGFDHRREQRIPGPGGQRVYHEGIPDLQLQQGSGRDKAKHV